MTRGLNDEIHKESMGMMDVAARTSGSLGDGSSLDSAASLRRLRRASRPLLYTKVARDASRRGAEDKYALLHSDRSLHRISRYWLGESPCIPPFTPSFAAAAARNCSACA